MNEDIWIKVTDQLPEPHTDILWYDEHDDTYYIGWIRVKPEFLIDSVRIKVDDVGTFTVTHWQPLPPKPFKN